MRTLLITFALISVQSLGFSQERLVGEDYNAYYDWFNKYSKTAEQYEQGSTLYVFGHDIKIFQGPCEDAKVVTKVKMGQTVKNMVDYTEAMQVPEDEINGYGDIWYQVGGKDANGKRFSGFLWGGHIAKAWAYHDFTGDQRKELVMLGLSPAPKRNVTDIKAEIRILQKGNLLYQKIVPGLCVFEDCGSNVLLRVIPNAPVQGSFMLEASTMTVSCFAGIEKAFYNWDGQRLNLAYHAEYTTKHQFANQPFRLEAANGSVQICRYSQEGNNFTPEWSCKDITPEAAPQQVRPKAAPVARAR
ncbi:MAG: hypothetical protein KTR30_24730 [Saprospiraceae bacterium]|nr:hypothetical protein [Saprospiraceae bacterium]